MGRCENKRNCDVYRKSLFYRNSKPSVKRYKNISQQIQCSMTTAVPCSPADICTRKMTTTTVRSLVTKNNGDLLWHLEKVWRRLPFSKCRVCCHRYRAGLGLAAQNCGATVPLEIFSGEGDEDVEMFLVKRNDTTNHHCHSIHES